MLSQCFVLFLAWKDSVHFQEDLHSEELCGDIFCMFHNNVQNCMNVGHQSIFGVNEWSSFVLLY